MANAPRVLMVCTGNICRSAMAEMVLGLRAAQRDVAVEVTSAGISNEEQGRPMDRRAVRVLAENGVPSGPREAAHRVTDTELAAQDLILAMTAQHYRVLRSRAGAAGIALLGEQEAAAARARGEQVRELRMFREFEPGAPSGPIAVKAARERGELDVPDPWYGNHSDFVETLETVEAAVPALLEHIRSLRSER
ncbi:MAG: low molecular weight protein-tyrosine-phosphatase [Buchananella hordeovulneris]|nr:low molecular weight protein-tyrosine-phosphatase [Buchananella hordeovulneris]